MRLRQRDRSKLTTIFRSPSSEFGSGHTFTENLPKDSAESSSHVFIDTFFSKQELQKDTKMKKTQGIRPRDVLQGLQAIRDIYNLPRIPVDPEGGCLCYYCEKYIKRARRGKFFKLPRYFCIIAFLF